VSSGLKAGVKFFSRDGLLKVGRVGSTSSGSCGAQHLGNTALQNFNRTIFFFLVCYKNVRFLFGRLWFYFSGPESDVSFSLRAFSWF